MKKFILISLILCLFNNNVKAQDEGGETYPKFTLGLEWGYIASMTVFYHHNFYAPEVDGGISIKDESLGIDWQIPTDKALLSEKDMKHALLKDFDSPFTIDMNLYPEF